MNQRTLRGLYIITDCQRLEFSSVLERTDSMLRAGVAAVQYRDKESLPDTRVARARELHELCSRYDTPLIINDDIDTYLAVGAEGIHVGKDDVDCALVRMRAGKAALLGVSCYNSLDRAVTAEAAGADYVAFGSMFPTATKRDTVPATAGLLARAKRTLTIPVAAIGGITPENCPDLIAGGADLLAVISSVYLADDPAAVVRRFNDMMQIRSGSD